jgi:hypothetical protein
MDWTRLLSVRRAVALFVALAASGTVINGGLSLKLEPTASASPNA